MDVKQTIATHGHVGPKQVPHRFKRVTRKEISAELVEDAFFEKGHLGVTIKQSLLTIVFWGTVILPFIWLLFPLVKPHLAAQVHFRMYLEEFLTFRFLTLFLPISFILLAIFFVCLTIRNNHNFENKLYKEILHDEERADKRTALMENLYTERFGSKETRESLRFYSVPEELNLETDTIRELYKQEGVALS